MGKTHKDRIKAQDIKINKRASRDAFQDTDLRTRVVPRQKKEKGGGKNWRNEVDNWLEEDYEERNGG